MTGNIWEWCWDHFAPTEQIAKHTDHFKGPDEGDQRVVRGSSFNFDAWHARAAYRTSDRASLVEPWHGFRVAKNRGNHPYPSTHPPPCHASTHDRE